MAFLLSLTRPITSSGWAFQKAWVRCVSDVSDFIRPPGPQNSWTRDEHNAYGRWRYATDADYRQRSIQSANKYATKRYANYPIWRQAKLEHFSEKYANDPEFRQSKMQRDFERRNKF
jgi:hypothetical protein